MCIVLFHRDTICIRHKRLKVHIVHCLRQRFKIMVIVLCLLLDQIIRNRLHGAFLHNLLHHRTFCIGVISLLCVLLHLGLSGFPDLLLRLVRKSHFCHLLRCHCLIRCGALNAVDCNGKYNRLSCQVLTGIILWKSQVQINGLAGHHAD